MNKRLRFEILRRDNFRCRYCGTTAAEAELTVDHVTPVALGGTDDPGNLATACDPCNNGKTSTTLDAPLVADVAADALRWAQAMKQAAENLAERQKPAQEYREVFVAEWSDHQARQRGKPLDVPDDWKASIERFRVAGLPASEWAEIIETGMTNRKVADPHVFRYCCGIAWKKVTAIQEEARRILRQDDADHGSSTAQDIVEIWADAFSFFRFSEPTETMRGWVLDQAEVITRADTELRNGGIVAAVMAGYFGQPVLLDGLTVEEQPWRDIRGQARAGRLWGRSYKDANGWWPSVKETAAFKRHLDRCTSDPGFLVTFHWGDLFKAAVRSGAYQDPDLSTCLTRRGSAIAAVSAPLQLSNDLGGDA